jgi:hypothetical protein
VLLSTAKGKPLFFTLGSILIPIKVINQKNGGWAKNGAGRLFSPDYGFEFHFVKFFFLIRTN